MREIMTKSMPRGEVQFPPLSGSRSIRIVVGAIDDGEEG
jgi:hypothetical protein